MRGPGLAPQHDNRKESYQQQKSNSGKGLLGLLLEGFEFIRHGGRHASTSDGQAESSQEGRQASKTSRPTPSDLCLPSTELPQLSQRQCHQLRARCSHARADGDIAYSGHRQADFHPAGFCSLGCFHSVPVNTDSGTHPSAAANTS